MLHDLLTCEPLFCRKKRMDLILYLLVGPPYFSLGTALIPTLKVSAIEISSYCVMYFSSHFQKTFNAEVSNHAYERFYLSVHERNRAF